ncbi:xanthine dehydrogenase family protein molybdopterin-binding subunit [Sesbania bispinosa]|nr:xanthine dehydrogenase family protein molybdopterin-binding subunit [Sesbania bispinosa]
MRGWRETGKPAEIGFKSWLIGEKVALARKLGFETKTGKSTKRNIWRRKKKREKNNRRNSEKKSVWTIPL